jgi:hypothetical protein
MSYDVGLDGDIILDPKFDSFATRLWQQADYPGHGYDAVVLATAQHG